MTHISEGIDWPVVSSRCLLCLPRSFVLISMVIFKVAISSTSSYYRISNL